MSDPLELKFSIVVSHAWAVHVSGSVMPLASQSQTQVLFITELSPQPQREKFQSLLNSEQFCFVKMESCHVVETIFKLTI